jgi:hypothetical protein
MIGMIATLAGIILLVLGAVLLLLPLLNWQVNLPWQSRAGGSVDVDRRWCRPVAGTTARHHRPARHEAVR